MSSTVTKVVSIRLRNEVAEYFKDKDLREILEQVYENGGSLSDQLNEIAFLYDINGENLVKNVRYLLDSGKLFVREGRLCWNPLMMNPEYMSVDDRIDSLKISDKEKDRIRQAIISNLESMTRQDDTGNGGGL